MSFKESSNTTNLFQWAKISRYPKLYMQLIDYWNSKTVPRQLYKKRPQANKAPSSARVRESISYTVLPLLSKEAVSIIQTSPDDYTNKQINHCLYELEWNTKRWEKVWIQSLIGNPTEQVISSKFTHAYAYLKLNQQSTK